MGDINVQCYEKGNGGYFYWYLEVYLQVLYNEVLYCILLFMFYLNDVEEGGSMDFYYQDVLIQFKVGCMVIVFVYFIYIYRG